MDGGSKVLEVLSDVIARAAHIQHCVSAWPRFHLTILVHLRRDSVFYAISLLSGSWILFILRRISVTFYTQSGALTAAALIASLIHVAHPNVFLPCQHQTTFPIRCCWPFHLKLTCALIKRNRAVMNTDAASLLPHFRLRPPSADERCDNRLVGRQRLRLCNVLLHNL